MDIKKLGTEYQKTGNWTNEMQQVEDEYLMSAMEEIIDKYQDSKDKEMGLYEFIGLMIGMWQVQHGFYRPWDSKELYE